MRFIPSFLTTLSQQVNSCCGGKQGYSICASAYEAKLKRKVIGKVTVSLINLLFFGDKQHCRKAWMLRPK